MEIRCKVCGSVSRISKAHKDYTRLARKPNTPYICDKCGAWIQFQMQHQQGLRKTP